MTTLEKQFMQIFERKDRIIEQVQQQADAYAQQLASTLLIDGITPPHWLWNPSFDSHSSDPNELKKEEIISKLLLRTPRDSIAYSTAGRPLYYEPVIAGENRRLSNGTCLETSGPNKGLNTTNGPTTVLECCDDDNVGFSLNRVPEQESSVNSPQDKTDARISDIYAAPDQSLARIQRSRSRQKALELRSNVKDAGKSSLSHENQTRISFSENSTSRNDVHEVLQDKFASESAKCNDINGVTYVEGEKESCGKINCMTNYSGRHARSSSSYENPSILNDYSKTSGWSEKGKVDSGTFLQPTEYSSQQSAHVDGVMKAVNRLDKSFESLEPGKSTAGKTMDTQRGSKDCYERITRSRSSNQQSSGINKYLEPGTSFDNSKEGSGAPSQAVGNLMHQLDASCKSLHAAKPSGELSDCIGETQALSRNESSMKPVKFSNISDRRITRSRSGATKESSLAKSLTDCEGYALRNTLDNQPIAYSSKVEADQEGYADIVVRNEGVDVLVAVQPVTFSGTKLDNVTLCMESEGLSTRQSSDHFMVVKPKQLDFDHVEEHGQNETCSPASKKRKLGEQSGQQHSPPEESAAKVGRQSNGCLFEQQSPAAIARPSLSKDAMKHPHDNIDECAEKKTINFRSNISGKLVDENVSYKSEAATHDKSSVPSEMDITPSDVCTSLDGEHLPENFHLIKEYESLSKMQIREADLGYKVKESAAAVCIPENKHSKSNFISNSTEELNQDSQDCLEKEARTPQSIELFVEEFEVRKNSSLPNMKFDSAKVNTWPQNQKRKIEHQSRCLSASGSVRTLLHHDIQRDAITRDLEAVENDCDFVSRAEIVSVSEDRDVSQFNANQSCEDGVRLELMSNSTERSKSLHKPETAQAIISEVDHTTAESLHTPEQSGEICDSTLNKVVDSSSCHELVYQPFLNNDDSVGMEITNIMTSEGNLPDCLRREGKLSYCSFGSPQNDDEIMIDSDETMPVFEGFVINEQTENTGLENAGGGIDFETLELPSAPIERASILEQICKSASKLTPLSQFSSTFKLHRIQELYQSVPIGLLEHMGQRNTTSMDEDYSKHLRASYSCISEVDSDFPKSDWCPFSATPFDWKSKHHYSSPYGKLRERSASSSGSSEKHLSLNPELTCFPIEEDPTCNEDNENGGEVADEIQEDITSRIAHNLAERVPPADSTVLCFQDASSVSPASSIPDRGSLYSVNTEVNFPGTHNKVKHTPKNHHNSKISRSKGKENQTSLYGTRTSTRSNASLHSDNHKPNRSNVRNGLPRPSRKEAKHGNIVSNITSFIPIVQQKQAASVCTGKRDIKVKALEAAEAAKRHEKEKENERKMKKEAMQLERARIEKENAREMELNKKKRQEEQKKREADIAARKRQREEDERKEKAKKRKHVAEVQKEKKLQHEKLRTGKVDKEKPHSKNDDTRKEACNATNKNPRPKGSADCGDVQQLTSALESHDASLDCDDKRTAISMCEKSPLKVEPVTWTNQEKSYDISPYQCSDDEDEDEDDISIKKFVPSWASKNRVALVLPLQQKLDPETIFSPESFCSMDEVLLPRRLQSN